MAGSSQDQTASKNADRVLAQASATAPLDAPLDGVDLADWAMSLTDEEYRSCAPGEHKGCGVSVAGGRPTLICTEEVGGQLMVQHYVAQKTTPHSCVFASLTDSRSSSGWSTVDVTWSLEVRSDDGGRTVLSNGIVSRATQAFAEQLASAGVSLADAGRQRLQGIVDHNRRETPAFAASIARHAARRAAPDAPTTGTEA